MPHPMGVRVLQEGDLNPQLLGTETQFPGPDSTKLHPYLESRQVSRSPEGGASADGTHRPFRTRAPTRGCWTPQPMSELVATPRPLSGFVKPGLCN